VRKVSKAKYQQSLVLLVHKASGVTKASKGHPVLLDLKVPLLLSLVLLVPLVLKVSKAMLVHKVLKEIPVLKVSKVQLVRTVLLDQVDLKVIREM